MTGVQTCALPIYGSSRLQSQLLNLYNLGSIGLAQRAAMCGKIIYSHYYQPLPLVLRGYGAGNDVTAAGVFADLLRTLSWKLGV